MKTITKLIFVMTLVVSGINNSVVMFTETYSGSCSQTLSDDLTFNKQHLGSKELRFLNRFAVGFWLKFIDSNLQRPDWVANMGNFNYAFLFSDHEGNTLDFNLFSFG
jgi:hypothetical protein